MIQKKKRQKRLKFINRNISSSKSPKAESNNSRALFANQKVPHTNAI